MKTSDMKPGFRKLVRTLREQREQEQQQIGNIAAEKPENKGLWIVLDEDGWPIFCAGWPEACHEHINDAINEHDIDGAAKWKVRRAELTPNA